MPTQAAEQAAIDPIRMIRPRRTIEGISAVLLPFLDHRATIDWPGFRAHVARTADAGLVPAVNMDTGHVNRLDEATQEHVLEATREALDGRPFVAGAFVADRPGAPFDRDAYFRRVGAIQKRGGTPVIFQSHGLVGQGDDRIVAAYETIGRACGRFLAFELGEMFAPFGRIYSLETFRAILKIPACVGAKHSSLRREDEWRRLMLRDEVRPDFRIYTGNDLGIDMVMYGSDYLLGLSTFAPAEFARRDAMWAAGDAGFYELNDALQYLGAFAFRPPVPAYKHSASTFLKLRGWIARDATHPDSPMRPESDREILRGILERLCVVKGD